MTGGHIVGDAGKAQTGVGQTIERGDHRRADRSRQHCQHRAALKLVPQRPGLCGKLRIEGGGIDLGALEPCPGVAVRVGGVDLADEIARQAAPCLKPVGRPQTAIW
ncbi:MAG: hypothetical protein R3E03_07145 [Novosphingobium sp.]